MDGTKFIGLERYFSPGYWKGVRNQEIDKRQTKRGMQLSKNTLTRKSNETE